MKALVTPLGAPGGLAMRNVPEPDSQPGEAVIQIRASSLNRGELRLLAARAEGWRPGQNVAGVVTRAAADGSGPVAGTHVVALADEAGWAESVAVSTNRIGTLPPEVDTAAAALPMAGTTALRTLRTGSLRPGHRVLVTGAAEPWATCRSSSPLRSARTSSPSRRSGIRRTFVPSARPRLWRHPPRRPGSSI